MFLFHMKIIFNITILVLLGSTLQAQTNKKPLPSEINQFYQKYNIVKAFSSHQERSALVKLLNKNEPLPDFLDNRIRYIFKLIKDIEIQSGSEANIPNPFQQNTWKFQSSELQQVQSWTYSGDVLVLKVKKYGLPNDVNAKLISHYDDFRQDNFFHLMQALDEKLSSQSTAIHTWRNVNGSWVKDSVEKVFVE